MVTVAIVESGDAAEDGRRRDLCTVERDENVEVLSVPNDPRTNWSARQRVTLTQSSGKHVTWLDAGDRFTDDAWDCLGEWIEKEPDWDVVYADYHGMDSRGFPSDGTLCPNLRSCTGGIWQGRASWCTAPCYLLRVRQWRTRR